MIEDVINELVNIGKTGAISSDSVITKLFPYGSSHAYYIYDKLEIGELEDVRLILLFKGLVIAEKELLWHCGSTTPAAHIYQDIRSRNLDKNYSIANWAFQYSNNEYIPFGSRRHGESTAYEYVQRREDYYCWVAQEQLNAKLRKEERQKRAIEIAKNKRQSDTIARRMRDTIMLQNPEKQVDTVVNDSSHNLLFYMPVINSLLSRRDVSELCWSTLLEKLRLLKPTPFNKKLINKISKRLNDE